MGYRDQSMFWFNVLPHELWSAAISSIIKTGSLEFVMRLVEQYT